MILEKLDHTEHVRAERVSKQFKRVGHNLSWHNVTVLAQGDLPHRIRHNKKKTVHQELKIIWNDN